MSKRKNLTSQQPHQPSHVCFPLPTVRLLQEALRTFERALWQKPDALPNVAFAKQVVYCLKTKVEDMLQREDWELETPLDANEIHILSAGMQMYLLELMVSGQDDVLLPCFALCQHFSQLVEHVDAKQAERRG
ncbi:MAG: hypothetical protein JO123_06395 [Ktedonobacteraceae bacterium]|nr:hypothetical protein [Ktedonobacteraceae bacterium]